MTAVKGQYENMLRRIHTEGVDHEDRTGVGRRSIFGFQERFDLSGGKVPVPTSRRAPFKSAIKELLWFLTGSTNIQALNEMDVKFWDRWAVTEHDIEKFVNKYLMPQLANEPNATAAQEGIMVAMKHRYLGEIGPMYGAMWRNAPRTPLTDDGGTVSMFWPKVPLDEIPSDKMAMYKSEFDQLLGANPDSEADFESYASMRYYQTVDQIGELLRNLKHRPHSARHVVSAWIPEFMPFENLDPAENVLHNRGCLSVCHAMFQCFVYPAKEEGGKKRLSLLMYQRSVDAPVGAISNITQYAVLTHLLAHVMGMEAHEFIYSTGDCHIYQNQLAGVEEQLKREVHDAPTIWINPEVTDLFSFKPEDIEIQNYQHSGDLSYEIAR